MVEGEDWIEGLTYCSLSKMIWMVENVEGVKEAAERDDLCIWND